MWHPAQSLGFVSEPCVRRHRLEVGLEPGRVVAGIAEQHRALGRVGPPARCRIRHRPPLVALHAEVLVDVRSADREAELPRDLFAGQRVLGGPVRVVAHRAGLAEVVSLPVMAPLGVVRGHAPGGQGCLPLVAGGAAGVVGHEYARLFLESTSRGPTRPTPRTRELLARCSGCGSSRSSGPRSRSRPRHPAPNTPTCASGGLLAEPGASGDCNVLEPGPWQFSHCTS